MEKQKKLPDSFIQRMKLIVKKVGNASKLARLSDMSGAVIGKYLAGDSDPSRSRLLAIAEAANVNLEWLVTGKGPMSQEYSESIFGDAVKSREGHPGLLEGKCASGSEAKTLGHVDEFSFFPFLKISRPERSGPFMEEKMSPWQFMGCTKSWLSSEFGLYIEDLRFFSIIGNDMVPTIKPGETILVDRKHQNVRQDGIYLISLDGELMVKRLQRLPEGIVEIISDNPAYKPFSINLKKANENFQSLGSVIWAWGGRRI
ncbi:LexA family transcriptional regulator [bacterium]|nr:LexA family transcriptional regulator [bacterium]